MRYLRKRIALDDNWLRVGRMDCLGDIRNHFNNGTTVLRKLGIGELDEVCTSFAAYKIERSINGNMYKLIVEINFPFDVNKNEIKKYLENTDGCWVDDKIIVNKRYLEKCKGGYKFNFLGLETAEGEEIKIWR